MGTHFENYIFKEDIPLCRKFLHEIITTGNEVASFDYRFERIDGKIRWHSTRGSALRGNSGEIIGVLGVARDITERKLAEVFKNSEEKFRKAFLTSPDSININSLSDGMYYITINKGFTQIMGYSEEEVIENFN